MFLHENLQQLNYFTSALKMKLKTEMKAQKNSLPEPWEMMSSRQVRFQNNDDDESWFKKKTFLRKLCILPSSPKRRYYSPLLDRAYLHASTSVCC